MIAVLPMILLGLLIPLLAVAWLVLLAAIAMVSLLADRLLLRTWIRDTQPAPAWMTQELAALGRDDIPVLIKGSGAPSAMILGSSDSPTIIISRALTWDMDPMERSVLWKRLLAGVGAESQRRQRLRGACHPVGTVLDAAGVHPGKHFGSLLGVVHRRWSSVIVAAADLDALVVANDRGCTEGTQEDGALASVLRRCDIPELAMKGSELIEIAGPLAQTTGRAVRLEARIGAYRHKHRSGSGEITHSLFDEGVDFDLVSRPFGRPEPVTIALPEAPPALWGSAVATQAAEVEDAHDDAADEGFDITPGDVPAVADPGGYGPSDGSDEDEAGSRASADAVGDLDEAPPSEGEITEEPELEQEIVLPEPEVFIEPEVSPGEEEIVLPEPEVFLEEDLIKADESPAEEADADLGVPDTDRVPVRVVRRRRWWWPFGSRAVAQEDDAPVLDEPADESHEASPLDDPQQPDGTGLPEVDLTPVPYEELTGAEEQIIDLDFVDAPEGDVDEPLEEPAPGAIDAEFSDDEGEEPADEDAIVPRRRRGLRRRRALAATPAVPVEIEESLRDLNAEPAADAEAYADADADAEHEPELDAEDDAEDQEDEPNTSAEDREGEDEVAVAGRRRRGLWSRLFGPRRRDDSVVEEVDEQPGEPMSDLAPVDEAGAQEIQEPIVLELPEPEVWSDETALPSLDALPAAEPADLVSPEPEEEAPVVAAEPEEIIAREPEEVSPPEPEALISERTPILQPTRLAAPEDVAVEPIPVAAPTLEPLTPDVPPVLASAPDLQPPLELTVRVRPGTEVHVSQPWDPERRANEYQVEEDEADHERFRDPLGDFFSRRRRKS
ncbi:hypothetical protein [Miltoncostaea oceani]|uniref:hypothetical protein n=1 Tax=Miltoncostaea oceani TaxID=2843216 RepID=UPI001C3CB727|nr:hypothetical protein [Miltoncostaea oceani]